MMSYVADNFMAIFRRTNTPMNPNREERENRDDRNLWRMAAMAAEQRALRDMERNDRLERNTQAFANAFFDDEAGSISAQHMEALRNLMATGTSVRRTGRRQGHQGGYDLVHKG